MSDLADLVVLLIFVSTVLTFSWSVIYLKNKMNIHI